MTFFCFLRKKIEGGFGLVWCGGLCLSNQPPLPPGSPISRPLTSLLLLPSPHAIGDHASISKKTPPGI